VYLNPLDHFAKHGLRAKGYVRYMDDFVLFGGSRSQLRDWGRAVKEKLAELLLRVHPDKYRLVPTWAGVDFVGFVVFEDGRIRVRSSSVRRFDRRFRHMLWEVERGVRRASDLTARVGAWRAHAEHAQSYGLRRAVLCCRRGKG
jgi:hypothetical protein